MKGLEHLNLLNKKRSNKQDEPALRGGCWCEAYVLPDFPHRPGCQMVAATVIARVANQQSADPVADDLTVPLSIECAEIERRAEHNRRIISKIMEILKDYNNSTHWDEDAFRALREIEEVFR